MCTENIGHVSYWARVFSLKACLDALNADLVAMCTENQQRVLNEESLAYTETDFCNIVDQMRAISEELAKI